MGDKREFDGAYARRARSWSVLESVYILLLCCGIELTRIDRLLSLNHTYLEGRIDASGLGATVGLI